MRRLDRALDPNSNESLPDAYWINRICEEFPCYGPPEAQRALMVSPPGWIEEVIESRVYARVRTMVHDAGSKAEIAKIPPSRLKDLAVEFMFPDEADEETDETKD